MKKLSVLLLSFTALAMTAISHADPTAGHDSGSLWTIGGALNTHLYDTTRANPSHQAAATTDKRYRINLVGNVSANIEVGQADNLFQEIEDLSLDLNNNTLSTAQANSLADEYNAFLDSAGDQGFATIDTVLQTPITPLLFKTGFGTIGFNVATFHRQYGLLLPGQVTVDDLGGGNNQLETDTAVETRLLSGYTFGLNYSAPLVSRANGKLYGGIGMNIHQIELERALSNVRNVQNGDDLFLDPENTETASDTVYSIDLGLVWAGDNGNIGLKLTNINEAEYDYASIGGDCSGLAGNDLETCNEANDLETAGRIQTNGSVSTDAQATLSGAYYLNPKKTWLLYGSQDLGAAVDSFGREYQWTTLGLSYSNPDNWLPGFRMSYRSDNGDAEIDYVNLGFTVFKYVNLDFGVSTDTVAVNNSDEYRGAYASVGISQRF